jgi:hypothetical protein
MDALRMRVALRSEKEIRRREVGETNSYPASSVTWHLEADDQHGLPTAVFQSMVCAAGMKVVRRIGLDASDGQLQPDSIKGERILWSEYLEFRSLVVRDHEAGAIVMAGRCFSEIGFERFGVDEANRWLRDGGCDRRVDGARNLSELYAIASGMNLEKSARQIGFRTI